MVIRQIAQLAMANFVHFDEVSGFVNLHKKSRFMAQKFVHYDERGRTARPDCSRGRYSRGRAADSSLCTNFQRARALKLYIMTKKFFVQNDEKTAEFLIPQSFKFI